MSKINILKKVVLISGNKCAQLKTYIKKCVDSDFRNTLNQNEKFRNIHLGDRCFILGNGPSLLQDDLSVLKDEIVFTVNQSSRSDFFKKVDSNYHFWADNNFFKIDETNPADLELLEVMKNVNVGNNKPVCFFPIHQKSFIKKFNLDNVINVAYFMSSLSAINENNIFYDFTKSTCGFGTVVQWCIIMALFMGFKEIYLLGCDNTGIISNVKSVLKDNDDSEYAYHLTENEKRRMESLTQKQSLEDYVLSYWNNLREYRFLSEYCKKHGRTLVNCSATTVIESIPRKRLKDVLNGE